MSKALLNRITVKTVYGDIKTPPTKEIGIMRVYGQATGYKVASSQYGDSLGFTGVFKAINLDTGEEFNSGKAFLPKVIENQLGGILDGVEGGAAFAFDIFIVPAANAFGYEYRVKSVIEAQESPIITQLEAQMGKLALAAPIAEKPAIAKKGGK